MEYLSDDEKEDEVVNELTFEDEYPDEELDEETRALCLGLGTTTYDEDDLIGVSKEKKTKKPTKKIDNSTMSLKTFQEKNEEKTKTWKSKRVESKRATSEVKDKVVKRQFNPRLPPYKLVKRDNNSNQNIDIKNNEMFPTIK